jgi:hypothetical protein
MDAESKLQCKGKERLAKTKKISSTLNNPKSGNNGKSYRNESYVLVLFEQDSKITLLQFIHT